MLNSDVKTVLSRTFKDTNELLYELCMYETNKWSRTVRWMALNYACLN